MTNLEETIDSGKIASRRSRARRGEGDKLRKRILDVAEKLLVEVGDQSLVSIRAISEACECTPPSIYRHFADKDELFLEVCERRFRELDERGERAAAMSGDLLESLRLRAKAYVEFGLDHSEHYRLLMMTKKSHEHLPPQAGSPSMDAFQHLVDAVQRCIDAGVFTDVGARPAAMVLWAGVHGITSLRITFPNFEWGDTERLVDLVLDVQVEGLLSV